MKKRLLAMLLVLMLVVSLLPVGALAADDGPCLPNGYNNSTSASISFSVPIVDAYKLLLQANESLSASDELPNIKNIVIKLKEEHPNPVVGDTLTLSKIGQAGNLTDYFWYENGLNREHKLEPSNIDKLVIYYKISGDEKAAEVQAKDLCLWYAKDGSIADYEISSYKSGTQIVVFCDNGESTDTSQGGYSIYAVRLVTSGNNLGENMPDPPDRISYDFVSWNTSPNGTGDIFNENTNVSSDIIVYARKVSSGGTDSGLQIRVMNDNNEFLTRFVELYNAKYNGNLTLDDIDKDILDSMKVVVNGYIDGQLASTNPDYYVSGVQHNGWADGYYKVYNRNASAIAGGQLSNDHIAINDITSITVTAKIKGTPVDVKMNRGSGAGEFEVSTSGLDAWWLIKFAGSPDKPESADLEGPDGILADSTVTVTCTTNEDHQTATYGLLSNSYEIGEVKATADGGYECTITVEPDMYVEEYGDDHALAEGETSEDITLVWDLNNNGWTVPENATPVNFNVTCEPEEPAPAPKLSVEKKVELPEGKKTAEVGDVLTYTITIKNTGNVTLTGINVSDTLDNGTSLSLYTSPECTGEPVTFIESLVSNETKTLFAEYTVTAADAGKTLTNTATATSGDTKGEDEVEVTVNSQYTITVNVTHGTATSNDGLNLSSTSDTLASGTITVNAGDNVTITFDNQEGYALDTVTVKAGEETEAPDVLTDSKYNIVSVDKNYTITVVYAKDDNNDDIPDSHQATVTYKVDGGTWDGTEGNSANKVYVVTTSEYETKGENAGTWVSLNKTINSTDCPIPTGMQPDSTHVGPGSWGVNEPTTSVALEDNGTYTYTYTFDEANPGLTVTKTADKETAKVGETITYTITVTNSGNTTLKNVVVTDTLTNAAGSVSLETSNKDITINNNTATINSLAPGAEVQITAKYTVLEADAGKTISNTAVAESGTTWDEPDTPPSVTVENPSLLISKTVSGMTGPKNTAKIGDVLTYTITVTNDGNVNLGKVTVEDEMMPTTITVDGVEKTIGGGGHVIENLDANENVVITYKYTVPDTLYPIKNTASATANDGTQAKIEISTDVYNPDMTVDKTVNKPVAEVGDTIKYTITVTNTGNVELTNVAVTDKMFVSADGAIQVPNGAKLDGNTVTISTLGVGETATITYTYTVLYWDEGDRIENTATVTSNETGTDPIKVTVVVRVKEIDTVTPPVTEPEEEFVPKWLNTEDHYAYIVGYEDGTIKPNNNITRAEVATIFFRLLNDDARARFWSTTNDFTDVAEDSWYNNAISTLSNMGIINGYEDGTFKPNAPITRAEFTAIATRFFDYEAEYDGAFNDVSARAWYADYVQAAVDMGLVDGYPDGGFHPDAYITRAEACTIVNRVLHRVPHEDHLLAESVMNTWPDNPKSAWYYEDMQEATNSHDYDWIRDDGETVEDWTKKLPERDWSALETEWATAYSR